MVAFIAEYQTAMLVSASTVSMQIQMIELQSRRILGIVSQMLSLSYPAGYIYIAPPPSSQRAPGQTGGDGGGEGGREGVPRPYGGTEL